MNISHAICPHCGAPLLTRHGVHLGPVQAEIFDAIERHGSNGVAREVLQGAIYPGVPTDTAFMRLKAHIWKINRKLDSTDFQIICGRFGPVRVVRRSYDAADDFAKSIAVGFDHIRKRVSKGGPRGFMGKP